MSVGVVTEIEATAVGARAGIRVMSAVPTLGPRDLEALVRQHAAALEARGYAVADVVRSRVLAPSREDRDALSAARFALFAGPARCASSSYIDEGRFPGGDGGRLESLALRGIAAHKVVEEYEPPEPPCRFVAAHDRVWFSGITSPDEGFETQLRRIAARLVESRSVAAERLGGEIRPVAATAWLDRSVLVPEWVDLPGAIDVAPGALEIAWCDGFSKPGKLIEIEVDAVVDRREDRGPRQGPDAEP